MLAFAGVMLGAYAFWIEPSSLRLTTHQVSLPDGALPKGLKIAVIADLHGGAPYIDAAKIEAVVAMTNAAKPDLILLTGDLNGHIPGQQPMPVDIVAGPLKSLSAPLGVYAVIGNHDIVEAHLVIPALRSAGIKTLRDDHADIPLRRGQLYLAGFEYKNKGGIAQALAALPKGGHALCFTHSPDLFPALPDACALTIAGHTHGGQVALPLLGRPIIPSSHGQRYAAGFVREGAKTLFVSTGIGTSFLPVRFGVPPEVSLLLLQ